MEAKSSDHPERRKRYLLQLPPAPASARSAVKAWSKPVEIFSFLPQQPDRNPIFWDKRVYQGSSGRVYPLPVIDRIATEPVRRWWRALHLENEFIRIMVLPEIGGRIHIGYDKTNGYDFFYRQNVIKPALVGLAGPWISGGVEFNWPQHHRPSTFMPVETQIERHPDGSITLWCSDYDPMTGLKGMHGVCLHPGKAYLELKVRLYNTTPFVHTFLWWANAAVKVHEKYQSFFPRDVEWVADHARRAVSRFPNAEGLYYGIDYGERARSGVPTDELPPRFAPDGSYPANDLSWYANIPVPTSYMVTQTEEDFFGGYDHLAQAGLVHLADHHIAPGKKQWTWGNHEFGYAWDRCLTEDDGPYIELMSGVYTDNQPDFSFLAPGETRTFSQYWYPIRAIGPVQAATLDLSLSLSLRDNRAHIGICCTRTICDVVVRLLARGVSIGQWQVVLHVAEPFLEQAALPAGVEENDLSLTIEAEGKTLLSYEPGKIKPKPAPAAAVEPPPPEEIETTEELYLVGLHLEQYRHATRRPELYWREALRRDPRDSRANLSMGKWHLRRGEFEQAEHHLRTAITRLTTWNANPYDGEAFYSLGLTLRHLARFEEAYDAFYKATWNAAWRSPALYALAQCDARFDRWQKAEEHLCGALRIDGENLNARNLSTIVKQKLGRSGEAKALLKATRKLDQLDLWSLYLAKGKPPGNERHVIMLALLFISAGLWQEAVASLEWNDAPSPEQLSPMRFYALAWCYRQLGRFDLSASTYREAAAACPDYCFPNTLDELLLLEAAIAANPTDARAHYYLGNLLYNAGRQEEAVDHWQRSTDLDPTFPTAWRNLGFAYFNLWGDSKLAKRAFDHALSNRPSDARVLYERDQLWKRTGVSAEQRLAELQRYPGLLVQRDDLAVELAGLWNQLDHPQEALKLLLDRKFQPWEGGEGLVLAQFIRSKLKLGQRALREGDAQSACRMFLDILQPPKNLGEAKHLLSNQNDVFYWLGEAYDACGDAPSARKWWRKASNQNGDFQRMAVQPVSEMTYWGALALDRLGDQSEAKELLLTIEAYAVQLEKKAPQTEYFATSLPAILLFELDLAQQKEIDATFLRAQAAYGMGKFAQAESMLRRVLGLDANHVGAEDLLLQLHLQGARSLNLTLRG